jgi:hypothetical protein
MEAQQELFTAFKLALEAKGYAVYDGFLPPEGTAYPFVYIGDFRQSDKEHKTDLTGSVFPTIHVWHNDPGQRGTVSQMLLDIKTTARLLQKTGRYSWGVRGITQNIFPDTTTRTPLLHGVFEAEFLFSVRS